MKRIRINYQHRNRYETMIEARQHKVWKAAVLKRDGFKCQFPNCNCKKTLQIHHILRWANFPTLRFEPANGVTLCKLHHKQITGMETIYQAFFMQVALNNQAKMNDKRTKTKTKTKTKKGVKKKP